jgi:hypothetical protein
MIVNENIINYFSEFFKKLLKRLINFFNKHEFELLIMLI